MCTSLSRGPAPAQSDYVERTQNQCTGKLEGVAKTVDVKDPLRGIPRLRRPGHTLASSLLQAR